MRPVAIIQARMGSCRLPGKVLAEIQGQPMLWHIVQRVRRMRGLAEAAVATSHHRRDEPIRQLCRQAGFLCFAGSERDVLDRYYRAACLYNASPILRITADCPFVDPQVLEHLLEFYATGSYQHTGVAAGAGAALLQGGHYPHGLDAECLSFAALQEAWAQATDPSDREHVTPYLWRLPNRFRTGLLTAPKDYSGYRWTVDYPADLEMVRQVYASLYPGNPFFGMHEIIDLLQKRPDISQLNQPYLGRENYQRIWNPDGGHQRYRS